MRKKCVCVCVCVYCMRLNSVRYVNYKNLMYRVNVYKIYANQYYKIDNGYVLIHFPKTIPL